MINLRYPFLSSNVYSSAHMMEGAKRIFQIYTQFLKSVPEAEDLHVKFSKYCNEDCAAKEMFSCLRRQVYEIFKKDDIKNFEANIRFVGEQDYLEICFIMISSNVLMISNYNN